MIPQPQSKLQSDSLILKFQSKSLNEILQNSDIISLHISGTEEIIGKKELNLMKKSSILINCARGGVVNEKDLVEILNNNNNNNNNNGLAYACLDCYINEPPLSSSSIDAAIYKHPLITTTPHIGAATFEAQDKVQTDLAHQIIDFINQKYN